VTPIPLPRRRTSRLPRRSLGHASFALLLALGSPPTAVAAPAPDAPVAATDPAPFAHSLELKVLSYNVKGLPLITDLDRLKRIGAILAERRKRGDEPDVVVLQEAFVRKAERVRNRAGYPYAIRGPAGGGIFANDSGLEVLSNYRIVARRERTLNDCAFPDCFVSKAILGVDLELPGVPDVIQVFTTHLQADTRNESVRRNQIDDITVFLNRIRFGRVPAIFAGDFNFKPKHPSYHKFLRQMPVTDVGYQCLGAPATCDVVVDPDGRTDLTDVWKTANDHQFYYQPTGSSVRIEPIRVIRNFTERIEGGEHGALSDHWGYEVHYRIRW
jgi:endonuclease/exonuclease/phosphatase family metal-dependent hydrolase